MAESQKQDETGTKSTKDDTQLNAEEVYESVRRTLQALDDMESRWKVSKSSTVLLFIKAGFSV